MTKKILTVLGARPQFIKAKPVSQAIAATPGLMEVLVHTGQHYDQKMSDVFFQELGLPRPNYMLEVGSGSHGAQTGRMLESVEKILLTEKPDCVLVYGDTNSTIAGSLAASKLQIPVAHVEAGLRSFNRAMPEEINRIVTDHLSDLLFTPTEVATAQLRKEGIPESKIHQVGDVMLDSVLQYSARAKGESSILSSLGVKEKGFVLATVHRASNTDDLRLLENILRSLAELSSTLPVVFPVHPRTRKMIREKPEWSFLETPHFKIVDPVGYIDMIRLEQAASMIVTDSGGVQKEAFFFSVPCVTIREETEWVETVAAGWNQLVTPESPDSMRAAYSQMLGKVGKKVQPYGDGTASLKIAKILSGL